MEPYKSEDELPEADFHIKHKESPYRVHSIGIGGSVGSSPSVINDLVVFGCNDTYVYALDKYGSKVWDFKTNDLIVSSPTCYRDFILVGSADKSLYSLSSDGELRWKFLTGGKVWSTPAVADGVVYFGSNNGIFYALSLEDGKELWRFHSGSGFLSWSPALVNNSIIFGNTSRCIFCISDDGRLLWKFYAGTHNAQTPLVIDKRNNEISSFRNRSFRRFPKGEGTKILMGSGDGYFRCLDKENGNLLWKIFTNVMGGSCPTILDEIVYFGSYDGRIYAVNTDGTVEWKFQTNNKIISSPICNDNIVYFGSSDNNLYALKTKNGQLMWRFLTEGEVMSSPMIHDGVIYFGCWDGHLYAVSVDDETLLWKFRTAIPCPSFIPKPMMVSEEKSTKQNMEFVPTQTIKGYAVKSSNYSPITGELTGAFYGTPVKYKPKSAYDR